MRRNCCILATLRFQCVFISPRFGNNAAQGRNAGAQIRLSAARSKGEDMMTRLRPTIRLTALCTAGAWGLLALATPHPAAAQDADATWDAARTQALQAGLQRFAVAGNLPLGGFGALFGLLRAEQFLPLRFTAAAGGSFFGLQRIHRAGVCAQFGVLIDATGGLAGCHPVIERGAGGLMFLQCAGAL